MSKIEIIENIDIFLCPVCGKKMKAYGTDRIACKNNHSFDLSRSGYVNLLTSPAKHNYGKAMLESRSIICRSGFFNPMIEHLSAAIISEYSGKGPGTLRLLDAGCGEGSHLAQISDGITADSSAAVKGFGIDISKDGIQLASRNYKSIAWCVADLARLPFAGKQFDVILSILSPSNYKEFNRVMADDGILLKVIPGSRYLKELRSFFYSSTDKETYSSDRVIEHFKSSFGISSVRKVEYTVALDAGQLEQLIKMTPLCWRAPEEKVKSAVNAGISSITVELYIIAGKKTNENMLCQK